jgi:hydroxymethylbilane synthase
MKGYKAKMAGENTDKSPAQKHYLPLGINMEGLKCLVVGGGRVGARKALTLAQNGAAVTVMSPEVSEKLRKSIEAGAIRWKQGEYSPSHLGGYSLVVAATSEAALNIAIGRDAEARHMLSCVVSPGRCSRVIFPATCREGNITVAVHSNGRDCGTSRKVRDRIAGLLKRRRPAPQQLAVFGVERPDVPQDIFRRLTENFRDQAQNNTFNSGLLFLVTCERWECYILSSSPRAVIREVRGVIQEKCGFLPESFRAAFYAKYGLRTFHHLLRIVSGLDSPLLGETEIVGQVRSAVDGWLGSDASRLKNIFTSCLSLQKKIRQKSGLFPRGKNWAEVTVSLLERRIGPLQSRRVLLIGCGKLGERIAERLLEKGAKVFPFSRRAKTCGVDWCSRLGLAVRPPEELADFLSGSDAIVVSSALQDSQAELISPLTASNKLIVVDLAGCDAAYGQAAGNGWYFGLADIASVPLSGKDAARIAYAEKLAVEKALRWQREKNRPPQLSRTIKVGGRASTLSRVQLEEALHFLHQILPDTSLEVVTMDAPCDRDKKTPLSRIHEDDFFTRDIDAALLRGEIDLAIHSVKDLPSQIPEGLSVAAVTPALAPWECLVAREGRALAELPRGAKIGTSSERRRQGLRRLRGDLSCCDVRGNVPDRLRQLEKGKYDGLILAAAGLIRLGLEERITQVFSLEEFPPAPGQGALAFVVREEDTELCKLLEPLDLGERKGLLWA